MIRDVDSYKDLTDGSHKTVLVECDSGKNSKCLEVFEREWRKVVIQRKRTHGKDFCKFCQKTEEFSGRNNPNTKYFFDDNYLEVIDTPEKAYLLGWIASDGSIGENMQITIAIQSKDVEVLKYLRTLLDRNIPIKEKVNTDLVSISISSTKLVKDCLRHLGLSKTGVKHSTIQYPDNLNGNDKYFIRGYFEGDGHVGLHGAIPRVSIASNSENMLEAISTKIAGGCIYLGGTGFTLEYNAGLSAINFLNVIYSDLEELPAYLDRKYNKYLELKDWKPTLSYKYVSYGSYNIKVNKLHPKAIMPVVSDDENSGLDLFLIEKIKDLSFDVELYTTGLRLTPPPGYYFIIVPRSSMSKTIYSLANSVGIIDESYRGEILVALRRSTSAPIQGMEVPARMVQAILMPKVELKVVEESINNYEQTSRGAGGFGSTG